MKKHCKGCLNHHNAKNLLAPKYNNWCTVYGDSAAKAIGWCKLTGAKRNGIIKRT